MQVSIKECALLGSSNELMRFTFDTAGVLNDEAGS